jgi:hypothetical protein
MTSESTSWIGQQLWAQYGFSSTTYGIDVQRRPGYWVNLQRPKSVLTILLRQSDKTRWQQRILRPTSVHLHQNKQWNWPPTASSGSSRFRSLLEPTGGACVGHPEDVMMIQKEVCTGKTSQMNHTYGKREQLISIRSLPNWWDKQQGLPTVSSNVWVDLSWCHRRSSKTKKGTMFFHRHVIFALPIVIARWCLWHGKHMIPTMSIQMSGNNIQFKTYSGDFSGTFGGHGPVE